MSWWNPLTNARYASAKTLPSAAKFKAFGSTLEKSISSAIPLRVSIINALTDSTCKRFNPNNSSTISAYKSCLNGITTFVSCSSIKSVNSPRIAFTVAINLASATFPRIVAKDLISAVIISPDNSSSVNSSSPSTIPGTNLLTSGNATAANAFESAMLFRISASACTFASTKKFSK